MTVRNPIGDAPKIIRKSLALQLTAMDDQIIDRVEGRFDDSEVFLKQRQAGSAEFMPCILTGCNVTPEPQPATT